MHNDERTPIATGHLSYSSDLLKYQWSDLGQMGHGAFYDMVSILGIYANV